MPLILTAFLNTPEIKETASVTMAVNSSCVTEYLDLVHQRSRDMLSARAYLHWYERHGTCQVCAFLFSFLSSFFILKTNSALIVEVLMP